jgi:hypothetical protein
MRVAIPLVPWAISISLERRSRPAFRWRYRLRTLLILVAIVALLLGGWAARRRHQIWQRQQQVWAELAREYRDLAERCAQREARAFESAATGKTDRAAIGWAGKGGCEIRLRPAEHKRIAAEQGRLKRKYEQAAASPWIPIGAADLGHETLRIAEEQGVVWTAEPPPWATGGRSTALPKASATPGE